MQTVIVELMNQNALALLRKLEEMHIIKLLEKNKQPLEKLSDKFAGKLSVETGEELQKHITKSRNEWNGNS